MRSAFILAVLPRPLPGGHALEVWGELDDVAVAFRQSDADGPLQILIVASVVAPVDLLHAHHEVVIETAILADGVTYEPQMDRVGNVGLIFFLKF